MCPVLSTTRSRLRTTAVFRRPGLACRLFWNSAKFDPSNCDKSGRVGPFQETPNTLPERNILAYQGAVTAAEFMDAVPMLGHDLSTRLKFDLIGEYRFLSTAQRGECRQRGGEQRDQQ